MFRGLRAWGGKFYRWSFLSSAFKVLRTFKILRLVCEAVLPLKILSLLSFGILALAIDGAGNLYRSFRCRSVSPKHRNSAQSDLLVASRFVSQGGPKYPRGAEVDTTAVRELMVKAFKHAASSHNGKVAAAAGGAGLYFIKVRSALT